MGVVAGAAIVVGAGTPPGTGVSDERLFAIAGRLKCLQCVGESVAASQSPMAAGVVELAFRSADRLRSIA